MNKLKQLVIKQGKKTAALATTDIRGTVEMCRTYRSFTNWMRCCNRVQCDLYEQVDDGVKAAPAANVQIVVDEDGKGDNKKKVAKPARGAAAQKAATVAKTQKKQTAASTTTTAASADAAASHVPERQRLPLLENNNWCGPLTRVARSYHSLYESLKVCTKVADELGDDCNSAKALLEICDSFDKGRKQCVETSIMAMGERIKVALAHLTDVSEAAVPFQEFVETTTIFDDEARKKFSKLKNSKPTKLFLACWNSFMVFAPVKPEPNVVPISHELHELILGEHTSADLQLLWDTRVVMDLGCVKPRTCGYCC